METLINFITDPKIISLLTVPIVAMVVESYAIYKLFQKYSDLQEKRIAEWKQMNTEYIQLSTEINRTLDTVLKLIGKK